MRNAVSNKTLDSQPIVRHLVGLDLLSTTLSTKYSIIKIKLTPHALCTDPLGSSAQESNTLDSIPLAAVTPRSYTVVTVASSAMVNLIIEKKVIKTPTNDAHGAFLHFRWRNEHPINDQAVLITNKVRNSQTK